MLDQAGTGGAILFSVARAMRSKNSALILGLLSMCSKSFCQTQSTKKAASMFLNWKPLMQ
jgi:hypothetical protein